MEANHGICSLEQRSNSESNLLFLQNAVGDQINHDEQKCDQEEKEMNFQGERDVKIKTEQDQKGNYYCMTCHKKYRMRISLLKHRQTHESNYRCEYEKCERKFRGEAGLARHRGTHERARPFACDFQSCTQQFNQKSNLNRHKRIHRQQKPFICQKCCKSFTTTTNLKQHVQIHLEDRHYRRKFVCEIKGCQKEYLYMCNLKKHHSEHQDPFGQCITQKDNGFHFFSVQIGACRLRIVTRLDHRNHSEIFLSFKSSDGANIYDPALFSFVLAAFAQKEASSEEEETALRSRTLAELQNRVQSLLDPAWTSVTWELPQHFQSIAKLIIGTVANVIATTSMDNFTVLTSKYSMFVEMVKYLLDQYPPKA